MSTILKGYYTTTQTGTNPQKNFLKPPRNYSYYCVFLFAVKIDSLSSFIINYHHLSSIITIYHHVLSFNHH